MAYSTQGAIHATTHIVTQCWSTIKHRHICGCCHSNPGSSSAWEDPCIIPGCSAQCFPPPQGKGTEEPRYNHIKAFQCPHQRIFILHQEKGDGGSSLVLWNTVVQTDQVKGSTRSLIYDPYMNHHPRGSIGSGTEWLSSMATCPNLAGNRALLQARTTCNIISLELGHLPFFQNLDPQLFFIWAN